MTVGIQMDNAKKGMHAQWNFIQSKIRIESDILQKNMGLKIIMLSKMRQTQKGKIFIFCSYNLYLQELFGKKKVNFLGLLSSVKNVGIPF